MKRYLVLLLAAAAYARPVHLRCDYLENPLGIDDPAPRLSWQSDSIQRNWRQSAYQILVASTAKMLAAGNGDVWDSGKQSSAESIGIVYGGPKLQPRHRYYWTVRVWDASGAPAMAAGASWWEMGLGSDWNAKWISWQNPEAAADGAGIHWIWVDGQNALAERPGTVAHFRLRPRLSGSPKTAQLSIVVRGDFKAQVNGREVDAKSNWGEFDYIETADLLHPGNNSIDVTVTVPQPNTRPAAVAALLKTTRADGTVERMPTNALWEARLDNESQWKPAVVVADLNDARLGKDPRPLPQPAALLRREVELSKRVQRARLYVTALGSYRVYINGRQAGNDVLTPDYTGYRKRVLYQTYDVTSLLVTGRNAVAAMLGDGWFGSGVVGGRQFFYLPAPPRLLAQLEVQYQDGTHDSFGSDSSWKTAASSIRHAEIYAGEVCDGRLEQPGWEKAGFNDASWQNASIADSPSAVVFSQTSPPVRIVATIRPKAITQPAAGVYVFDMGQNMVGWAKLRVNGPAGATVRLRFAEILKPDGNIYRDNLRNADATDTYILRGGAPESYTPRFTFHGFRYVEVTGYPGTPRVGDLTGEVLSSLSGEPVAHVTTASDLVNRMWGIGIWGQRGNFLSVPTDCPQRDERLGWMGDAGVFWRTGSYNFDIAAFSEKWMRDVVDAQMPEGAFTNISPDLAFGEGAPGWGDAGVIVPWTTWLQYGDKAIVQQSWNAMERWMKYIQDANPDFIRRKRVGPNFGDWLAPNSDTPKDLIGTAYWALIADMMSQMAHAIDRDQDAKRYAGIYSDIRSAFQKQYIKPDGVVGNGSQTCYVLALHMKLAPDSLRPAVAGNLVKDIEAHDGHLTTGFLGAPFLLFALADNGRADVAYRLLLNDTYPSWGYMLKKGATTWWERWNGDTGDPSMNSFNHYAFGSVMAWVYRSVAGIDTLPGAPGFREVVIHPRLDARMPQAAGEYDSIYGRISTEWRGGPSGPFSLKVTIPPNTTARVFLPVIPNGKVTERGKPVEGHEEDGSYIVTTGSGSYDFEVR